MDVILKTKAGNKRLSIDKIQSLVDAGKLKESMKCVSVDEGTTWTTVGDVLSHVPDIDIEDEPQKPTRLPKPTRNPRVGGQAPRRRGAGGGRSRRETSHKTKNAGFWILVFFGAMGGHHFYVNSVGMGILYFLTGGLFGFGVLYDVLKYLFGTPIDSEGRPLKGTINFTCCLVYIIMVVLAFVLAFIAFGGGIQNAVKRRRLMESKNSGSTSPSTTAPVRSPTPATLPSKVPDPASARGTSLPPDAERIRSVIADCAGEKYGDAYANGWTVRAKINRGELSMLDLTQQQFKDAAFNDQISKLMALRTMLPKDKFGEMVRGTYSQIKPKKQTRR